MTLSSLLHELPPEAAARHTPPERFTYPFYYRPHPLALAAARDLQRHLLDGEREWQYDFGLERTTTGSRGKMFGVLVVGRPDGTLAYLAAYSGKLAESNHLPGFVPPVFDLLDTEGFYKIGEAEIDRLTQQIQELERSPQLAEARSAYTRVQREAEDRIAHERTLVKEGKRQRKATRSQAEGTSPTALAELERRLSAESIRQSYGLKDLTRALRHRVELARQALQRQQDELTALKDRRSQMSNELQQRIFTQYTFLNREGERRDLGSIFRATVFGVPPAGAGECAAPKLLQFAYLNRLRPICLAEFWWGQSPASAVRRHRHYYPACRGKCEPILGHMLGGLTVDPNPMLQNPAVGKALTTVYEDDHLMVIDKPADFLSVPGKRIEDSVWLRIKQRYPTATGPLIVHRLDMSTSGLMMVSKTKEAHKLLQRQFFQRTVRKRYLALVEGVVSGERGTIDLPLRGDLEDRPRQIVCTTHGKNARSHWEVVHRQAGRTLLYLWPVTGRTHQLRVHCAHPDGLDAPIVGDDLYGQPAERLYLHAERLTFNHPYTQLTREFCAPTSFAPPPVPSRSKTPSERP